nr:sigma 54-interacting transcriptional regulator [Bacillus subtilis]
MVRFQERSACGKKGLFEEANNGSIFLDEIGELTQNMHTKLLARPSGKRNRQSGRHESDPCQRQSDRGDKCKY